MDEIVKQALHKWPDVPHCYDWLALDQRGQWWLRDSAAQSAGRFPDSKGWMLDHAAMIAFIGRNYQADAQGQWYFQNGPQRVYVELENTPVVWHWQPADHALPHYAPVAGAACEPQRCLVDEDGRVYLVCDGLVGVVHSQDVLAVADWLGQQGWEPEPVQRQALPEQFGFVRSPAARVAKES